MSRLHAGAGLLLAVLLTACAPPLPVQRTLAEQVTMPDAWRTAAPAAAPIRIDWWRQAGDEALNGLVDRALAHNLDIALAAARVQEARAQEAVARAALRPSVDASLGASRARSVSPFGTPSLATGEQPQLLVAYELDLFGRVRQQTEAARQGLLQTQYAQDSARLAVAAAAVNGYVTLRALDQRLRVLRETLTTREESLRHARERVASGYSSQQEVAQARAELESVAQQIPAVQAGIERQEHALALLSGQPPAAIARGKPVGALTLPAVNAEQPSALLRRRPDITQAEAQLAATDAQLAVARAQFLPQIRLQASLGRVFSSALADPIDVWSLGGSLLAPLFHGGQLQGQFDAAAARRDQAALAYQKTVLTAFKEVEDNLSTIAHLGAQQQALQRQSDAANEALRHATARYLEGYSSLLERIDAQRQVLAVDLAMVQVQADGLQARVGLHQALGGGWQTPP